MKPLTNIIIILLLVVLTIVFSMRVSLLTDTIYTNDAKEAALNETVNGSYINNLVTAVYLDYRFFDTLFEGLLLFITVAGIIFMSKKDDEVS